MPTRQSIAESDIVKLLRDQVPVRGLSGVQVLNVNEAPRKPFDVSFEIESGSSRVKALGEVRVGLTPKTAETIAPWLARLKAFEPESAFVIISPYLSPPTQAFCTENGIDFMDLAGNISIDVPGKMVLRRLGMKGEQRPSGRKSPQIVRVYSGRSSRVPRVLLQRPGAWSLTAIAEELASESERNAFSGTGGFAVSLGTVSKVLATLEEELLIRRRGSSILVPEPLRLLNRWAEKYREQYRRRQRSSFTRPNPFGERIGAISEGLAALAPGGFALTGAASASVGAPFVDVDLVEVFVAARDQGDAFRGLKNRTGAGKKLRFVEPYDFGVFMYSRIVDGIPIVSDVQTYLDLYARGGRDLKQAEYLLEQRILPRWSER